MGGAEVLWAGPERGVAVLRGGGTEQRFLLLLLSVQIALHLDTPPSVQ